MGQVKESGKEGFKRTTHTKKRKEKRNEGKKIRRGGTCEMTDRKTEYILFTSAVKSYFICVKKKTKG